jgi:hypothetical protein
MDKLTGINLSPRNVFVALKSLNQVSARLRVQRDARAVFPDVYAVITRRVAEEIAKGKDSIFLEPEWIGRLAGLFAVRYFESLLASLDDSHEEAQPSQAWRLAYAYAAEGLTLPAQDAFFGINAHINFDLAQGIYDNIVASGATEDERMLSRYRHDHDAVNQLLEDALPECMDLLVSRYRRSIARLLACSERVQSAMSRLTLAMLKLWRDRVWSDVLDLLAAKKESDRAGIISRMNRDSGLMAGLIGAASLALRRLPGQIRETLLSGSRRLPPPLRGPAHRPVSPPGLVLHFSNQQRAACTSGPRL